MRNVARKLELATAFQAVGDVVAIDAGEVVVRTEDGVVVTARRATSCLVEPLAGDRVLVGGSERAGAFVLAVLAREAGGATSLSVDGDVTLRANGGALTLAGARGVDVVSEGAVQVAAPEVSVRARRAGFVLDALALVASAVDADAGTVKLLARSLDSTLDRITARVKRSLKVVEELDAVRAEQMDYTARQTLHMHADNAVVTARTMVKVDAEQIQLG